MANLKEVRTRIESVKSTQQITKAMKMVAASKLRRAQDAILQMRPYVQKLYGILENVSASLTGEQQSEYSKGRDVKKVLVVVITSDRGLCGGFNANVIKAGLNLIEEKYRLAVIILLGAALVLYPFVRVDAPDFISSNIPSEQASSKALNQLLTNIYSAFDYQTEEAVYDQLAISATGDQLVDIYLEHQSAMELEDRGGARASVDRVEIMKIQGITTRSEGVMIDASWIVSGSVSHFGHIHYRKNLYNASVFIQTQEGNWKISGIEVKEKERIL